MTCPQCHSPESETLDTRRTKTKIRRRRQCSKCGHRFTTQEIIVKEPDKEQQQVNVEILNNLQ